MLWITLLAAVVTVALCMSVVHAATAVQGSIERWAVAAERSDTAPELQERLVLLAGLIQESDAQIARLTLAVEEGIERVSRAESRVTKTVASARTLLAKSGLEHAGLEAEAEEIRERDGEPGPPEGVQPVYSDMEDNRPSGIPGLTVSDYNRMRGVEA